MPESYDIIVKGHLDDTWAQYFPGLTLNHLENGQTLLSGSLPDQSALHGVLERIRDLNLVLESLARHSSPDENQVTL